MEYVNADPLEDFQDKLMELYEVGKSIGASEFTLNSIDSAVRHVELDIKELIKA